MKPYLPHAIHDWFQGAFSDWAQMHRRTATHAMLAILLIAPQTAGDDSAWRHQIDLSRADLSLFTMVLIQNDKPAGSMRYEWRRSGDTYVISDRTEMEPNILETATAIINAETLLPQKVDIDFAAGNNRTVFDLTWNGATLNGEVTLNPENQPPKKVPVSGSPNAALRMSVFGAISAMPLKTGFSLEMPWYNSMNNTRETVHILHTGIETVVTPAGEFEAHKVELKGGTPENIIYVTIAKPQKIVRIDVVGMPLHFERIPD